MVNVAARAEEVRDLKRQMRELDSHDEREVIFRDTSPRRNTVTLWSMVDGEPITIPSYMLDTVMNKRLHDGRDAYTGKQELAPEYRLGQVKCFMNHESPEAPILREELGIMPSCPAVHLANTASKRIHGQHRHKQEWAAYQEWKNEKEREEDRADRRQQLDATLAIAGKAATRGKAAE